jgi:hypothetical protein
MLEIPCSISLFIKASPSSFEKMNSTQHAQQSLEENLSNTSTVATWSFGHLVTRGNLMHK